MIFKKMKDQQAINPRRGFHHVQAVNTYKGKELKNYTNLIRDRLSIDLQSPLSEANTDVGSCLSSIINTKILVDFMKKI